MADFCKQCSIDMFGKDFNDLAGITTDEDIRQQIAAYVICEGCGPVFVNPDGSCMGDCLEGHSKKNET